MNDSDRRAFLLRAATGSALLLSLTARAQPAMVSEKDATAAALGYNPDTFKVDARRFPRHSSAQKCSGCQLYTGRPGDGAGGCNIFVGKLVSSSGWCSAFVPRA